MTDGREAFVGDRLKVGVEAFWTRHRALVGAGHTSAEAFALLEDEAVWALGAPGVTALGPDWPRCLRCGAPVMEPTDAFCDCACLVLWDEDHD
jgi:hypothetical protein